jgi:spore maturation protein CgeB
MKVLIVHPGVNFSVADVYNGLAKGLRECGAEVALFNLDDRINFYSNAHVKDEAGEFRPALPIEAACELAAKGIEVVCYEWWPDVVVIVSGFFVPPKVWQVLRSRPHTVVYWATESPYEDDRQAFPAEIADLVALNDPVNVERFRSDVNPNTHYFAHSYDPEQHRPGPINQQFASDFAFVGTGFPSRIEWLERVDWSGVDVKLGGNWQSLNADSPLRPFLFRDPDDCMDNAETADVYRSTRAALNLYRKETSDAGTADGWAMGPREVELAACGVFFFRESRGEGDELFPMLPLVGEPEAFGDELRWWLARPVERVHAANAARAAVADRTFRNTAARLLRLCEASRKIAA